MLPNPSCAYSCGTTPSPCLKPTTPLQAAGIRVEPPPSVATAIGTRPAATATAEPRRFGQALLPEFRRRGLTHDYRASALQPRNHLGVVARHVVLENQ